MYLMIQIPTWISSQILVLCLIWFSSYCASSLRCLFEIASLFHLLMPIVSLSLIECYDIRPVLKLILGTALLGVISYHMPALLRLDRCMAFLCQWYLWPCLSKHHENWYPNDEKSVKHAFKIYAYVMVVILTIMGLVMRGSWKNQQAEADRPPNGSLTEVVTDLWDSYQRVTQGRSLLKTLQISEFIAILPCHHRSMRLWRLNAQPLRISNCP